MLYDPKWKPPVAPVKSKRKTWRTLMLQAANVLEEHGWTRHTLGNTERGFCTIGAIRYADTGNAQTDYRKLSVSARRAEIELSRYLNKVRDVPVSIVSWNDRIASSKIVLRTLKKVAKV